MITRRDAVNALGLGALAAAFPLAAQPSLSRISWLSPTRATDGSLFLGELRRGLSELGYVEGRNIVLDLYWGEDSAERTPKLIADVLASNPRVIVAQGAMAPPLRRANASIPVVFGYSGDPVEAGLVESLARPGGSFTGISYMALDLVGKRFQLIKEALPAARRVAVLAQPQHPGDRGERRASESAAAALGLSLEYFEARGPAQLPDALAAIEKSRSDAVVMFPVQTIMLNSARIAAWSIKNRIPAISGWAQFAEGGNLMSYGPNLRAATHRLAVFVDRILKGAKPADLPVELPTRVELVVNMKAARALGIRIPPSILLRAESVIE